MHWCSRPASWNRHPDVNFEKVCITNQLFNRHAHPLLWPSGKDAFASLLTSLRDALERLWGQRTVRNCLDVKELSTFSSALAHKLWVHLRSYLRWPRYGLYAAFTRTTFADSEKKLHVRPRLDTLAVRLTETTVVVVGHVKCLVGPQGSNHSRTLATPSRSRTPTMTM